ncbi:MAG: bifunctional metallophosphatase/5'-nucleotidase [Solobacterium sp.]|nr:bifunctional metallophosphatase/5'-nucleotidase [Solobacterium sp.]
MVLDRRDLTKRRTDMKELTILHSNDMHGDFLIEQRDGVETGGLVRLSGYVQNERLNNPNMIYAVAGDFFRGSIIDSEYLGLSTIDLINILRPDVATIGNHEIDYGLAHLLFLEKCADFPIINANLYVTLNHSRLFQPHLILERNGLKILFIGLLTEQVIASAKTEKVIGSFIDTEEAAKCVGIICDNYRTEHINLTILLTHIGIEEDRKLAELLPETSGVDLIIGGHSHTFMEEPEYVNGIPIVQAGTGTDLIGRCDLIVDEENNCIHEMKWQCVPINSRTAPKDKVMEDLIMQYKDTTDRKYRQIITHFPRQLTHPSRTQETELGNMYADIMQVDSSFDVMLFGSGAIRNETLGPVVELQDMLETTPYDDCLYMFEVTGAQYRKMILHILRDEAWEGHTEFYQFSKGVRIVYRRSTHELLELSLNGEPITDDMRIKVAVTEYHFKNFDEFLGIPLEEVSKNKTPKIVASSVNNIIQEYLSTHRGLDPKIEGRLVILD